MSNLESALKLAAAGYRIVPAKGKRPFFEDWPEKATTDAAQIRKWWAGSPSYNPAIATGKGLLVLDVDGSEGRASLQQLEEQHGKLPLTRTVITGGGGLHYYFRTEKAFKNKVRFAPGLDIRTDGGCAIASGGLHESGNRYAWKEGCSPDEIEEAPLPEWLGNVILTGQEKQRPWTKKAEGGTLPEIIPEGQRNDALYKHGCFLRGKRGYTMKQIEAELRRVNEERCSPPLDDSEIETIIGSVDKYARAGGAETVFAPVGLSCFADVPEEEPRFLLHPYIPEGAITILQGNPGDGKTALLCKLAAIVSTGGELLGESCTAGSVLLLSVEDDASTLRGRIAASGGDLKRCFFVQEGHTLDFLSPQIEDYVQQEHIRLLAFDPLQAFLGRSLDMNKSNETRPVLAALAAMAKRNSCAVVLVSHLGKATKDGPAIYRALGSVDIPGAARSVLHVGRNAENLEQRIVVHIKSSNAKAGRGVAFRIGDRGGVWIDGPSDVEYTDLAKDGKKTRAAVSEANGLYVESIIRACKKVLEEYPNGKRLAYAELTDRGDLWPDKNEKKGILIAMTSRLEKEGIAISGWKRLSRGITFIVAPLSAGEL